MRLFFTPIGYKTPEKERNAEKFAQLFSIEVKGIKIQCYAWGTADKTVLLIHGWAGRATQFRRFIKPLLKAGYKVIGFDGPAHGKSGGRTTTFREFEDALKSIYARTGQPEAIIAHSYGGSAALYAAMNGLSVPKLINIASPTIGDEIVNTYLKAIGGSQKTKEYFYRFIQAKYGKPFHEFSALHFVRHLPQKVDLLLIHDEDDKEVSMQHPLQLLAAYPSAQLFKTSGLGHTRILKDDDVIRKCVTFITDQPSTESRL